MRFIEKFEKLIIDHKEKLPALMLVLFGAIIFYRGIHYTKRIFGLDQERVEILVTARAYKSGRVISPQNLATITLFQKNVPKGVIYSHEISHIQGYTLNNAKNQGEILFWSDFNDGFAVQSPSGNIREGYRVISIPVDPISSAGHLIQSGDHVDLILTMNIPGENKPSTLTLLQNVTVFYGWITRRRANRVFAFFISKPYGFAIGSRSYNAQRSTRPHQYES